MVDASTSMTKENFQKVKVFLQDLIQFAGVDNGEVRIGMLTYSTSSYIHFHLDTYFNKRRLLEVVGKMPYYDGASNIADAFRIMRMRMFTPDNGDRTDAANIGILLTDGPADYDTENTIPEATKARQAGITVYTIAIGQIDTDDLDLDSIVSRPSVDYIYTVDDYDDLEGIEYTLGDSLCLCEYIPFVILLLTEKTGKGVFITVYCRKDKAGYSFVLTRLLSHQYVIVSLQLYS